MWKFDGTFGPFAQTEEYLAVNRECVRNWMAILADGRKSVKDVLDLATGTGTMASIFLDTLGDWNRYPRLTCLDRSPEALALARETLGEEDGRVVYLEGDVANLKLPSASMDIVLLGNGIHYLTETEQVSLAERVKEILRPGGYFFFNTAFFDGTIPEHTASFYQAKTREAVKILRESGIERARDAAHAEAANLKPLEHYRTLVGGAGMKLVQTRQYVVQGSLRFYQGIGSYFQYARGLLRGYPVEKAAEALIKGTQLAFDRYAETGQNGKRFILRYWLSVGARA